MHVKLGIFLLIETLIHQRIHSLPESNSTRSFPDVFLIGVQKGGTSSLYSLLAHHPMTCSPKGGKETHFFDHDDNYIKGSGQYADLYSTCSTNKLTIDGTPVFSYSAVPYRIMETYTESILREKKFIVILREPVSREFSYYEHRIRECYGYIKRGIRTAFGLKSCEAVLQSFSPNSTVFNPVSFREYKLRGSLSTYAGEYVAHLQSWFKYISRKQIFIISMETLLVNTTDTIERLFTFLGLEQIWGADVKLPHDNDSSFVPAIMDCFTRDELALHFSTRNMNLYSIISNGEKPSTEPPFYPFDMNSTKRVCVDTPTNMTDAEVSKAINNLKNLWQRKNISSFKSSRNNVLSAISSTTKPGPQKQFQHNLPTIAAHKLKGQVISSDTKKFNISLHDQQPFLQSTPYIFLMGVQKGGTTSLHELLVRNPQICAEGEKEKHFFSRDWIWEKGVDFYESLFADCPQAQLLIDASPMFFYPDAPDRILRVYNRIHLKHKKFILVLREPVAREFSWFEHRLRECSKYMTGKFIRNSTVVSIYCSAVLPHFDGKPGKPYVPLSFAQFYAAGRLTIRNGDYKYHLERWLKVIHRNQLMILNFQTLMENTTDTMFRIQEFLQLKVAWGPNVTLPHDNESSSKIAAHLECETFKNLTAQYSKANEGLLDIINHPQKPPEQPPFPSFELADTRSICV